MGVAGGCWTETPKTPQSDRELLGRWFAILSELAEQLVTCL